MNAITIANLAANPFTLVEAEYAHDDTFDDAIEPIDALLERAYAIASRISGQDLVDVWDDYARMVESVWRAYCELDYLEDARAIYKQRVDEIRAAVEEMFGEVRIIKPRLVEIVEDEPTIDDVNAIWG